jgi:hypothetical protein
MMVEFEDSLNYVCHGDVELSPNWRREELPRWWMWLGSLYCMMV